MEKAPGEGHGPKYGTGSEVLCALGERLAGLDGAALPRRPSTPGLITPSGSRQRHRLDQRRIVVLDVPDALIDRPQGHVLCGVGLEQPFNSPLPKSCIDQAGAG